MIEDQQHPGLLGQWQHHVRVGIERMQESGEVSRGIDPHRASGALIAAIQGGVTILLSPGSAGHLEAALDLCLDHLRTYDQLRTRRRRDASKARTMCLRPLPPAFGSPGSTLLVNLVVSTTRSRTPASAISSPSTVSLSPAV